MLRLAGGLKSLPLAMLHLVCLFPESPCDPEEVGQLKRLFRILHKAEQTIADVTKQAGLPQVKESSFVTAAKVRGRLRKPQSSA